MICIDGSQGEGGGQILRTSLALAIITAQPVRIERIRAKREKPGLRRQHLVAVRAAATISGGKLTGAEIGSRELEFHPRAVRPGRYRFDIGSAGSTTLVLQTILPPLLQAGGHSTIELTGGTHNPFAPPADFLQQTFLPLLGQMGADVSCNMERPGFYPAGGGKLHVEIAPSGSLTPLRLVERGAIRRRLCRAVVANLPEHIGRRELTTAAAALNWPDECLQLSRYEGCFIGTGNVVNLEIESEHVTEVFTGFGRRGVAAEKVAGQAAAEAQRYLDAGVPVGEHLADQLLLPLALAGGGEYVTLSTTSHLTTNADIIRRFLSVQICIDELPSGHWRVAAGSNAASDKTSERHA